MLYKRFKNTYLYIDFTEDDYKKLYKEFTKDMMSRIECNNDHKLITNKEIRIVITNVHKNRGLPKLFSLYANHVDKRYFTKKIVLYTLGYTYEFWKQVYKIPELDPNNICAYVPSAAHIKRALLEYDWLYKIDGTSCVIMVYNHDPNMKLRIIRCVDNGNPLYHKISIEHNIEFRRYDY